MPRRIILIVLLVLWSAGDLAGVAAESAALHGNKPVVVELFTSQG